MDYIRTKRYRLYHGDCFNILPKIKDKSIDLILCDLPYGTTNCRWDTVLDLSLLWKEYIRIVKDNAMIILFANEPYKSLLITSNIKNYKYDLIWIKEQGTNQLNAKRQPLKQFEYINLFSFGKLGKTIYNPQKVIGKKYSHFENQNKLGKNKNLYMQQHGYTSKDISERYPTDILYYQRELQLRFHPTQKPVALLEYLIKTYSNDNNIVLDNCMGSGSTGIACLNTSRRFIGIEKENKFFKIAVERIQNHRLINLFGNLE